MPRLLTTNKFVSPMSLQFCPCTLFSHLGSLKFLLLSRRSSTRLNLKTHVSVIAMMGLGMLSESLRLASFNFRTWLPKRNQSASRI
jgi:hypothetical protein